MGEGARSDFWKEERGAISNPLMNSNKKGTGSGRALEYLLESGDLYRPHIARMQGGSSVKVRHHGKKEKYTGELT